MRVETRVGGDGVSCWNVSAIKDFEETCNQREARLARDNPDLVLKAGLLKCYGCEALEYDNGVKCTAELTRTLYVVDGEIEPRPADAKRSLAEVPGFLTRAPDEVAAQQTRMDNPVAATTGPAASQPTRSNEPAHQQAKSRFKIFGR